MFLPTIISKSDGFVGILIDIPIILAPNVFNQKDNQEPLNPV